MLGDELLLGSWATTIFIAITTLVLLYWLTTKDHDYWKKRGIPYVKPVPLLGSILDMYQKPLHEVEIDRYTKHGQMYGYYSGSKIHLSVGDPKLIRDILVKDFPTFHNRVLFKSGNETSEKLINNIQEIEEWRRIRNIITPTFSTGKIKKMLSIFKDCSGTLIKNFRTASEEGEFIDVKKLFDAFIMDVITTSAFSIKLDSHNDPDNQFVKYAKKTFQQQTLSWGILLFDLFPPIAKVLKCNFFRPECIEFFKQFIFEIIEKRKKTGETRNDFLQMMMDTAKGEAYDQNLDQPENEDIALNYELQKDTKPKILKFDTSKSLSMVELVAQCVFFLSSGQDTTLCFATYLLALNPDVQDRLRTEVDETLKESKGEITYEAIQSMKYLDNVISETLRMYPPTIRMYRTADADYKLGDTGITIPKGMLVTIPTYAIHRDPNIFPDPDKFNPDRFTAEEKAKRDPYSYHPFGDGPRKCIAMRFILMVIKVCLADVIANFYIKRCPETMVPLEFGIGNLVFRPTGIILEMENRKDSTLLT